MQFEMKHVPRRWPLITNNFPLVLILCCEEITHIIFFLIICKISGFYRALMSVRYRQMNAGELHVSELYRPWLHCQAVFVISEYEPRPATLGERSTLSSRCQHNNVIVCQSSSSSNSTEDFCLVSRVQGQRISVFHVSLLHMHMYFRKPD